MGLLGSLKFALKCIDVLAWPLFALGYPLCASIRAIETNSNYHMRKLVTYWIVFSLISLFELAFVKLIEWVSFWPYIKLIAICWLAVPRFNGAKYIYKCLVRPCLSVDLQVITNLLTKQKEEVSIKTETFLDVAERYVKENGSEALEKLIASKPKGAKPNHDVEEIKTVSHAEKKEVTTRIQSKCKETNVAQKDIRAVELTDQNAAAAANSVKNADPNVAETKKKTVAPLEIKEMTVPVAGGENKLSESEIPPLKKVQKEWTCAVCQVTTQSETVLNSHLQGKKHREKCEELKASTRRAKNKASSSLTANNSDQASQERKKCVSSDGPNQNTTTKEEKKVKVNRTSEQFKQKKLKNTNVGINQSKYWCSICNIRCPGQIDMASHLNGRKHLSQIQIMIDSLGGGGWA